MDSLQEIAARNGELSEEQKKNLKDAVNILGCLEEHELLEARMEVVGAIYSYYVGSRSVGHTRVLRQGIEEANKPLDSNDFKTKLFVVVSSQKEAQNFPGFNVCTLDDFKAGHMRGKMAPLAWDNHAIIRLVSMLSVVQGTFRRVRHIVEETTANNGG